MLLLMLLFSDHLYESKVMSTKIGFIALFLIHTKRLIIGLSLMRELYLYYGSFNIMAVEKIEMIKEAIKARESAIIAYSGGVDSATLAALAFKVLGEKALAVL